MKVDIIVALKWDPELFIFGSPHKYMYIAQIQILQKWDTNTDTTSRYKYLVSQISNKSKTNHKSQMQINIQKIIQIQIHTKSK